MRDQLSVPRSVPLLQADQRALPAAWKVRLSPLLAIFGLVSPLALCLLAFVGVPLFLIITDHILLIRYVFPILATVVGAFLFVRSPPHYLGLCLWLFFITPFVRRFVDASEGWLHTNPVMLSPYLASSFMFFSAVAYTLKLRADLRPLLPYALMIGAVAFGFLVGLTKGYLVSGVFDALRWSIPIFLALFLLQHRRLAREMRRVTIGCFLWALPVMGIYGIVQFVSPPVWDAYWMHDAPTSAFGRSSEALSLRVFSTMNSPQSFATAVAVGLLLLVCSRSRWSWLSGTPALIALLLTLSRAVAGAFVGSLLYFLVLGPSAVRLRTSVFLVIAALMLFASSLAFPALQDRLTARAESTTELATDGSAQSRLRQYEQFPSLLLDSPLGWGLSWKGTYSHLDDKQYFTVDSGIIETFLGFGVVGGLAYFAGLGICVARLGKIVLASSDPFVHACAAVAVLAVLQLPLQHEFIGESGFLIWLFIGSGLASEQRRKPARGSRGRQRVPSIAHSTAERHETEAERSAEHASMRAVRRRRTDRSTQKLHRS